MSMVTSFPRGARYDAANLNSRLEEIEQAVEAKVRLKRVGTKVPLVGLTEYVITNIPLTYSMIRFEMLIRLSSGDFHMRFNDDVSSSYQRDLFLNDGYTASAVTSNIQIATVTVTGVPNELYGSHQIMLCNLNTTNPLLIITYTDSGTVSVTYTTRSVVYQGTLPITQISFVCTTGQFEGDSNFQIYGYK